MRQSASICVILAAAVAAVGPASSGKGYSGRLTDGGERQSAGERGGGGGGQKLRKMSWEGDSGREKFWDVEFKIYLTFSHPPCAVTSQ